VALHTFAKDELLHQVMDDFFLLLWAAGPNNNCQHVNPLMEYYTGRSRAEFLGTGWIEMIHPDDREKTVQLCTENFRSRQAFQFRYRMRRRDRVWSWMQDHAEPRYRPDKSFAGYVGTLYQDPLYGPEVEAMAVTPPSWPLPASTGGIDSSAIRSKLN
jgi:PAS domain S-box-containing protein